MNRPAAGVVCEMRETGPSVSSRPAWILLCLACVLFVVQQLPYYQSRWVEDESAYSDLGWTFAREGRIHMSMYPPTDTAAVVDVHPPAMPIALGTVFKILGLGIWQARLLPFLCALGALLVTYRLGSLLADPWTGALAAFLLATDTLVFAAARTARPEAIIEFLNTLALLLFLIAMRRASWLFAAAAGLVSGLALNFHLNGAIAPIAAALIALHEYRWNIWRKPVAWAFAAVVIACVIPYALWINADPVHQLAYREMKTLGTAVRTPNRLQGELLRFADFLGFTNRRLAVDVPVLPVRAPIALAILGGMAVLYTRRRRLFWLSALSTVAALAWWLYLANKSVRYIGVASPVFALIVAASAVAYGTTEKRRRLALCACVLYAVTQLAGNASLVLGVRDADYVAVSDALRRVIPAGQTVYGGNTFWLALHDRPFYSFDRTPFDYALEHFKPGYLILNDRLLLHGSGYGDDDFAKVRRETDEFVRTRAERVAEIPNPFYGDLQVYRVRY